MDRIEAFIGKRSNAERALLMVAAGIAIFVAGVKTGEAFAVITGAA